ncbi:zinc transport protein ATPase [Alcanivorax hongdengensis A-11-3]|uniref:Zinc transport protein ATPase n=1 Tax=Alcanivorax hongdengensis A-11-3 TaxID=1177179 RepID=L0W9L3_9GAMM|nr:zinc ABC transporter ATP-binding protein ZnuC [Alcanivorax hongdengensis]EKF73423.1 zinc transport protein ATPase [Alcanivorax hongdengensis A-11-3]
MSEPLVSVKSVSVSLGGNPVLSDVSLTLTAGRITTLIGPNGAGKSTLARLVLGLIPADTGTISRRKGLRVGYMPQQIKIDDSLPLTVDRFLWLAASGPTAARREALQRAGVAHLRRRAVQRLSGGEMQRVLLARALLRKPDLLVLDEPAQGVDVAGQNALYGLLREVRDELGCAILLVSHDLHLVMAATDEVICLQRHVCCSGTPESVSRDPAYHELFGPGAGTPNLALYTHDHDHDHDLHGNAHHHHEGPCNHD